MRKIIASLDIGSNSIKLVVGEILKKRLVVLASNEVPSQGIKKGLVINPDLVYKALSELLDKIYVSLELEIKEIILNVSAYDYESTLVSSSINIEGEDNLITSEDIEKIINKLSYEYTNSNKIVVNVSPIAFYVDDEIKENIIGSAGHKLTVKALLGTVPKKNLAGIISVLDKLNIKVVDATINGLASSYCYRSDCSLNSCGAIIDIGSDTTTVSVLNKGIITASNVIDIGGNNIDNDLSIIFKITKGDSKYLKEHIGLATSRHALINETLNFKNKDDESIQVSQKECSEVIEPRLREILEIAKKNINSLTKKEISYIIITGGLSELKDFNLLANAVLSNNVIIGNIPIMGVRNNKYNVCVGLINYYNEKLKMLNKGYSLFDEDELKNIYKKQKGSSQASLFDKLFGYFFDN